jgi:DNA-binding transcriptional LysR family regulator
MLLRSSAELSAFRLLVLATVVEQQGFSAAAGQLELSQPSVSFHIRALERAFGTKLVIYQNRRVELTAEGEVVYASAKSILRELDELDDAVHKLLTAQAGSLRMGASINFEQAYFFARVIGPFRERHPAVRLSIQYGHSYQLAELVAQRDIDLAYVLDIHLPAGVQYEPLHQADFVFLAAPEHPLACQQAVDPDEIAAAGLITAPQESAEWAAYAGLLRRSGLRQPRISIEIDGIQARVLAARAGMGILGAFLPSYTLESDLQPLTVLRLTSSRASAGFGIVTASGREPSALTARFVEWLRAVAAAGPPSHEAAGLP